jgi:hypothetical protein
LELRLIFLRTLALLAALASVLCAGAYVFTRERKYLTWTFLVLKISAVLAFVFFAGLFAEELWFKSPK